MQALFVSFIASSLVAVMGVVQSGPRPFVAYLCIGQFLVTTCCYWVFNPARRKTREERLTSRVMYVDIGEGIRSSRIRAWFGLALVALGLVGLWYVAEVILAMGRLGALAIRIASLGVFVALLAIARRR